MQDTERYVYLPVNLPNLSINSASNELNSLNSKQPPSKKLKLIKDSDEDKGNINTLGNSFIQSDLFDKISTETQIIKASETNEDLSRVVTKKKFSMAEMLKSVKSESLQTEAWRLERERLKDQRELERVLEYEREAGRKIAQKLLDDQARSLKKEREAEIIRRAEKIRRSKVKLLQQSISTIKSNDLAEQSTNPSYTPESIVFDHRYISPQEFKPLINAADIFKEQPEDYDSIAGNKIISISLQYPGMNCLEWFPLVIPKGEEYDPIHDIYKTVQLIASECLSSLSSPPDLGDSKQGIIRNVIKACHLKKSAELISSLSEFNKVIEELVGMEEFEVSGKAASLALVEHILEQSYARTIAPNSHLLNKYVGFSNNVYGEIKHSFVNEIIIHSHLKPGDIFLDLGSGTGNVVLQVAAQTLCQSYGIEIMAIPAMFAKQQRSEMVSRLRAYCKPCGRIYLKQGDFLHDDKISSIIAKADVIFVNNYAFQSELNLGILDKLLDIKESCRVVSLRSFAARGGRGASIESIFTAKEYFFAQGSVSWMSEGGSWFVHTVNRSLHTVN